ncbi:Hypothetical protein CINCED_3A019888 [Cinara cedri]|uniref:Uncharacterized protein n=1 Tax=Cinara cedri TaxID=506608 RepID=A0A5E4MSE8_9HEMI|nr:Hypothetical protein CINCED_3A019888 [Cinara cedri]
MTNASEMPLYQLEFVVKSITQCQSKEDTTAVCISFLDFPEQMVCEIPPSTCARPDVEVSPTLIHQGKTYTFAMCTEGCGPRTLPITVRLYRMMDKETGREELATGRLDVIPTRSSNQRRPANDLCGIEDDDLTVPMISCADGRTIAVMTVLVQAWCAGSVTATPVRAHTVQTSPPITSVPLATGGQPASQPQPQTRCKAVDNGCQKKQQPVMVKKCCNPQPPSPSPRLSRRQCDQCLPARRPTGCATDGIPVVANTTRQAQYTSVGCEFDGHKMDMLVRKKNYETCAVQRHITTEAEAFASRVMTVIRDMHGLVSESVGAKTDQYDTC